MDNVILGLFIGIPSLMAIASLVAWLRMRTESFETGGS